MKHKEIIVDDIIGYWSTRGFDAHPFATRHFAVNNLQI